MMPSTFISPRSGGDADRSNDAISNLVTPLAQALLATPIRGAAPPAWIGPDLKADFVNVAGRPSGFHKNALSYVYGKGRVSTAAGQAAGTTVYQFPAGYWPAEAITFAVPGSAGFQTITVSSGGVVSNDAVIAAAGTIDLVFSFLAER